MFVIFVFVLYTFRHDSKVHQYRVLPGPDGKLYVQVGYCYGHWKKMNK